MRTGVIGTCIGLFAVAGAAGAGWWFGFGDNSHGAIAACEERTMEDLQSPASYKRIWANYTPQAPMNSAEYREAMETRSREACDPNCAEDGAFQVSEAYTLYVDKMGPVYAKRRKAGKKLSKEEERTADLWLDGQTAMRQRDERNKQNLPEDQTGFVSLEYDADNAYGATMRSFGMCRLGAIGQDGKFEKSDVLFFGPVDEAAGRQAKEMQEEIDAQ